TDKRYYENQCTWVAKNHFIDYIAPAFLGDVITAKTWIEDIKRSSSIRVYAFFNQHNKLIAKAQTTWVFIDTHTLRPKSILPEVHTTGH
ncbi:acyl-CoA thioesterase, partial [Facilibium subflavum]|uniref:acyl-CoA thioesterase n=1 Tax=Facilibium subflavum TaxID=2219058 RepID=UPI001F475173